MQEQNSLLATIHSLRSQALVSSTNPSHPLLSPLPHRTKQELQSMNIAARLYTVSSGRTRD